MVAYHANLTWARGGFLGVDIFFVLSGFLITGILLKDFDRCGHLRLRRFWKRRARRLLPAAGVLLVAIVLIVPLLAPDQGRRTGGDVLASLGYVTNWRLIFGHQSYFEAMGRPPLLQHLWSLAVEEQFYLLWPLLLAVALRWNRRRHLLGLLVLALAGLSTLLMVVLYDPEVDPSRVYYGTDTRAAALLVGAALACMGAWRLLPPGTGGRRRRVALEIAGVASLSFLGWCVVSVNQFDTRLYRGGFLVVALASAAIVAVGADRQRTVVSRVLGMRPLVWLGKRSYAVYLWFWPVLMLTRSHADIDLTGTTLLAFQVALIGVLASASYRFVEVPCRSGALGRAWDQWRDGVLPPRTQRTVALAAGALVIIAVGAAVIYDPPNPRRPLAAGQALPEPALAQPAITATTVVPAPVATIALGEPPVSAIPAPVAAIPARVTAIGESVLDDARNLLTARISGLVLDAQLGRQTGTSLEAARALRDSGRLGDEVILHVGNNGIVTSGQFDDFMDVFAAVRRVVVVNIRVPRPWEPVNNEVLAAGVKRHPKAVLVDWHEMGTEHPDLFDGDSVHLAPKGNQLLVDAIVAAL